MILWILVICLAMIDGFSMRGMHRAVQLHDKPALRLIRPLSASTSFTSDHNNQLRTTEIVADNKVYERSSTSIVNVSDKLHSCSDNFFTSQLHGSYDQELKLPKLTSTEISRLASGERIQKQFREGRAGNGIVVVEVDANKENVFKTLKDFHR